ncbi:MAG: ABC transporter permease [Gammaproteobacteria bacterium]
MPDDSAQLIIRPEFEAQTIGIAHEGGIARALTLYERVLEMNSVRKLSIVLGLVVLWELYTRIGGVSEYLLPPFSTTGTALVKALWDENLLAMIGNSITILLAGYVIGIVIAIVLTTLAVTSRFGSDLLGTLTAMLNPLPAIALLPMALLWFGLGADAIVFTLLHSVVWPVALNTHTGFLGVSDTQRMVGRNYGLRGIVYVVKILIPAAFPSILTGLRIGWAYAWRTLIAAELVFGGSIADTEGTASGGLGWFIFANQMDLRIPYVFAGLFTVIVVGVLVENVVFRNIEERTVARWGMRTP